MLITLCLGVFLYRHFSININLGIIAFALLGSLLPDIDHENSLLGRYIIVGRLIFGGHRNKSHTIAFGLICAIFIGIFNINFAFVFFASFLLHLLADITTVTGIPAAYPISEKKVALGWFKTNGMEENAFCLFAIMYLLL